MVPGEVVPLKFTNARQAYTGAEPLALKPSRIRRGVMKLVLFVPAWASAVEAMVGVAAAQDKVPEPFVVKASPLAPSVAGNVHVRFEETVAGA